MPRRGAGAGRSRAAGTILHDWGAHLVDQALQLGLGPCRRLTAWLTPAPVGRRRHRRTRSDRAGIRRRPLPGRNQPGLPDRPPPLVDRRHRRRVRQIRNRPPGRGPPRRRHRPGSGIATNSRAPSAEPAVTARPSRARVPTVQRPLGRLLPKHRRTPATGHAAGRDRRTSPRGRPPARGRGGVVARARDRPGPVGTFVRIQRLCFRGSVKRSAPAPTAKSRTEHIAE